MSAMLHAHADDNELATRYVTGKLLESEVADFEAHLVECVACQDAVEMAEGLGLGLRAAAEADTAILPRATRRPSEPSWRRTLAVAAAVAGCAVPLVFLARAAVRSERGRATAERELAAARAALSARVAQPAGPEAAAVLSGLQRENERLSAELEEARRPQVNVPLLLLSAVRSAGGAAAPVPRAVLPAGARWVVLSLELEPDPAGSEYAASVLDARGRAVWTGSGLRLHNDALSIALPAALLPPGRYRVRVEPSRHPGHAAAVYDFERAP